MITRVTNGECLARCIDYDGEALDAFSTFKASKDTADIDDTLEVNCPIEGCPSRDESYISEYDGTRFVRYGMFGDICLLNSLDNRGNL